ncbi:hypothetical protein P692DRAFT_20821868 [Suillus brevipes Sb2]|nr:hypothetical protein P692DRAFT_20821868 [Suillus brevipes Sb2]
MFLFATIMVSVGFMMGLSLGQIIIQYLRIASRIESVAYLPERLTLVEARIHKLTNAVQVLKEKRNSLIPLVKLPVELIFMVLSSLVSGDEPDVQSLVLCSQVCRRMRQICLDCPSLWKDAMDMSASPRLMALILRHSTPLPLSISIDFAQWNPEDSQLPNCATNLSIVASSLHRISNFHLHASPSAVSAVLSQFPRHAPVLETLYLGVSRMMGDVDHILQLPDTLMTLDAPLLHKVCLYGCFFTWDRFNFTNLVELRIVDFPDTAKPSLTTVLTVLSNLLSLQTLVMREVLSKLSSTPEQHANPVQLSYLQFLCIHCPAVDCAIFLDVIATEELRVLDLVCQDTGQNLTAAEMIKLHSALHVKTRAMDVRAASLHCDFDNVRLIGSTFTEANCEDVQALVMIGFPFAQIQSGNDILRRLVAFTKGINSARVQCLRLHVDPVYQVDIDDASWHAILSPFSSASHLHLTQPLRLSILSCLVDDARRALRLAAIDPTQSSILLPLLDLLDISSEVEGLELELVQRLLHEFSTMRGAYIMAMGELR